jgi:hypothetical protein
MKALVFSDGGVVLADQAPSAPEVVELTSEQSQAFAALASAGKSARLVGGQIVEYVPQTASSGDFVKALIELGWYGAVNAAVASAPGPSGDLARALWARASIIERDNPLLVQIATAISKTSADLDALFILANSYN